MQIETQVDQVVLYLDRSEAFLVAVALDALQGEKPESAAIRAAAARVSKIAEGGRA